MSGQDFPIVGIGASAGGLEALRALFSGTKEQTGMAFVVVQHLDPTHESLMAQLIERYTEMAVSQAVGGEKVEQDHIYVIPPGHGLAMSDGVLELTEFKDPRGMRRPIDDFFESLARDQKANAACVILSGTGGDGSRGLRAIKEHGGLCIAQEPTSASYDGMPSSAIATGLVDIVAAPREIVGALHNFFDRSSNSEGFVDEAKTVTDNIDELCDILREAVGHDFSRYKRSTLTRRIARRMQLLRLDDAKDYLQKLRDDEEECTALFRDLLINVTRFFRDSEQFETLREQVIEPLVEKANDDEELRVWVPGCSSGEEAFSIAMLFAEAARKQNKRPYVQIFATDIDEGMLDIARGGAYPLSALEDIPQDLRDRYVIGGSDKFHVSANIRDMVRFSVHNVMRDPPFSKIDLVSCRNLLIYFNESLQKQVIPLFHFSLVEKGRLFLGSSESIGRYEDLFEIVDQNSRIYRRKNARGKYSLQFGIGDRFASPRRRPMLDSTASRARVDGKEISALKTIAERYAPVSLLVDREGQLLERWGAAGRYLDFPDRLERQVLVTSLARPGLRELVGPLIRQVATSSRRAGVKGVEIRTDFGVIEARISCERIEDSAFLFVIEETGALRAFDEDEFDEFDMEHGQQQFLEEELQATRHRLRSTVEELETTNEELKSSNEEMMSMNEELQSTNEELTTVNDELKNKVDQLTVANSDLKNFFDSTQLAVVVVDHDQQLRSFTEAAAELFPIERKHIGYPLEDLPHNFTTRDHISLARQAAAKGEMQETRMNAENGKGEYFLRAIPYRTLDGEIDGATLIFTDVTDALSLERDLREERERLRLALQVARIGIWEYEPSTDKTVLDETERQLLGIKESDAGDTMQPILDALPEADRDRVNQSLRQAMDGTRNFDERFRIPLENGEYRWLHGLGKRIAYGDNDNKFIGVTIDITAERSLLEQRELMIREMNHRVKNLFSVISAMVSIAAREADEVDEFAEELRDRIHALGRSHSLTNDSAIGGAGAVQLRSLIETVVNPSRAEQAIELEGEDVEVPNSQITSIALILHEWATNAAKYGALSVKDGSLEVDWTVDDGKLTLDWREQGQQAELDDAKAGFGTRLMQTAARQLKGEIEGSPEGEGYSRKLSFRLDWPQL
ncbi:PAS domain-containing protein [Qipengyuania sp. 1NDW9]|uniref:CheR family methyltransferase n=1 Tax=Qipengyuania xiapuensis TaxID=2867236 RepID=UPI001C8809F6|nr:CheR family methyltransferase [Qipengyuania xiapuensis]MBX7493645.1 PAS domain-containing protein [Qipengyuania xiapuensis]